MTPTQPSGEELAMLTKEFLNNMETWFPNYVLHALDIREKGNKPYFCQDFESATKINDKLNHDIYFTPNGGFRETMYVDEKTNKHVTRRKEIAKNITCIYAEVDNDIDDGDDIASIPFEPTAVIKTGNGRHYYRVLDEPIPYEGDNAKEREFVQNEMKVFGGDPNAKDIARILRVPGYTRYKNNDVPSIIRCEKITGATYRLSNFVSFFQQIGKQIDGDREIVKKMFFETKGASKNFDKIEQLNVEEVLYMFESKYAIQKNGSIKESGRVTGGYKYYRDRNALVNFTRATKDRPEGGPWAIAKYYLKGAKETFAFFKKEFGIYERSKIEESSVSTSKETRKIESSEGGVMIESDFAIIKGPTKYSFSKQNCCVIKEYDGNLTKMTDFRYEVIGRFIEQDKHKRIIQYKKKGREEGTMILSDLGKQAKLGERLGTVGLTLLNVTKKDTATIIEHIHSVEDKYTSIKSPGIYAKDKVYNREGKLLDKDKKVYVDIPVRSASKAELFSVVGCNKLNKVKDEIEKMKKEYKHSLVVPLYLGLLCGMLSYTVRQQLGRLPNIAVSGVTQSGKTVTIQNTLARLGVKELPTATAQDTEGAFNFLVKMHMPLYIKEYQNDGLKFDLENFLKNNFDGAQKPRGTPDQKVIFHEMNAQAVVDGETASLNPSVLSRFIYLTFQKQYKGEYVSPREYKDAVNTLPYYIDNIENIKDLGGLVTKYAQKIKELGIGEGREESGRVLGSYALLMAIADCYGILDVTQDSIIGGIEQQFVMMGEEKVEGMIKQILQLATIKRMNIFIDNGCLCVDFAVDTLMVKVGSVDDIKSNISQLNHYFSDGKRGDRDFIELPLPYLFKKPELKRILLRVFGYVSNTSGSRGKANDAQAIKAFIEESEEGGTPLWKKVKEAVEK